VIAADIRGARRRWLASAGGALVITAALAFFFTLPLMQPVALTVAKPAPALRKVEIAKASSLDPALADEAAIKDQKPLFLPTERNVSLRAPRRPEAGRSVLDLDASRLSFGDAELKLNLPAPEQVPEKPAHVVLTDPAAAPLHGFGQANVRIDALKPRGGFVEVVDTATNRRVLAEALKPDAKPPTERPWRPMEFLARVEPSGLIGSLVITSRSDVEEVDNFFRIYLSRTYRIGERLPPGFYRIVVGP
jgi:hypothetical protein